MKRTIVCFFLLSSAVLFAGRPAPARAAEAPSTEEHSPRLLVHLLDYLAVDYGGAVKDGKILSLPEYKEQLEFVKTAGELSRTLPEVSSSPEIQTLVQNLTNLIRSKADPEKVATLARRTQAKVIELVRLPTGPSAWPNLEAGRRLFLNTCASCHGAGGQGDGPSAAALNPKPFNFLDDSKMGRMSPFQAFNSIRLGVPGTGMAGFPNFSDEDAWSLSFYILSLRYRSSTAPGGLSEDFKKISDYAANQRSPVDLLGAVATQSDLDLALKTLPAHPPEKEKTQIASLRLHSSGEGAQVSLSLARFDLQAALADYESGRWNPASKKALAAYVEGVEPVEPRLRANDPRAVLELEQLMGLVRSAINGRLPAAEVKLAVEKADVFLDQAERSLQQNSPTPWLTFTLALGILIREGFEALLLIVALLGVLRVSKTRQAEHWVHGGWMAAVGLGFLAWFFSGWLMAISGLGRELLEAVTGLVTVAILLYIGFWLHSRTEIHRWKTFIEVQVKAAIQEKNLIQLAFLSFLAAFREAIETVLFLRAIWLEGGSETKQALGLGVAAAFACILLLGWLLLTFSAKVPIKTLFNLSSLIMVVLAVILTGKAVHSLQEVDILPVTLSPLDLHLDWLGLYPTAQTGFFQLLVLVLSIGLWILGKRPPSAQSPKGRS